MKEKLYDYLVMLIFVELVLGGLGNLFGLPVRKALFAVGILYTLYLIYVNKVKVQKRYLMAIAVILIYVAFGCIIGLVKGNSFRGIIGDANSFLGIVYLLLLVTYFKGDVKKINRGIDIIVDSSVVVAIITIALFFFSRIYLPGDQGIIVKYMELNNTLHYGLITGLVHSNSYARVYLFNGIFMQIGALVIMTRLLFSSYECKISHKIKLTYLINWNLYFNYKRILARNSGRSSLYSNLFLMEEKRASAYFEEIHFCTCYFWNIYCNNTLYS